MVELLTIMRALADPTRLRIVRLVLQLELSVGELVQILEQSQPRVSRHIRILDEAGLLKRRKEGSWVFLRPAESLSHGPLAPLFSLDDPGQTKVFERDLAKVAEVRASRNQMAVAYFAAHADEWDSLRSLHVAESEVEDAVCAILATAKLGNVLDVGTGTGRMIELFADKADHFIALDNNTEMLRLARAKLGNLSNAAAAKVEILLGDFAALPLEDDSCDTVIFHQVLHYAQNPDGVIAEAARVLAPKGRLVIIDFAAHDREELRTVHAHARLGFADDAIEKAFQDNSLHAAHRATLEGGELAVKIWVGAKHAGAATHDNNLRIVA